VSRLNQLVPQLRPYAAALLREAERRGSTVTVTSVRRSRAEQRALYLRYLRGQSRYPVAPPGRSDHERGLALDLVTTPDINPQLGAVWVSWGGRWSPADAVHFGV
jgi:LAS superfamily LD-carboxypeptidase LdcB